MKKAYAITDPRGNFFRDYTESIPAVIHAFTDTWEYAWRFETLEEAKREKERLLKRLYDFGGNEKVPKDYLKIVKAELKTVG